MFVFWGKDLDSVDLASKQLYLHLLNPVSPQLLFGPSATRWQHCSALGRLEDGENEWKRRGRIPTFQQACGLFPVQSSLETPPAEERHPVLVLSVLHPRAPVGHLQPPRPPLPGPHSGALSGHSVGPRKLGGDKEEARHRDPPIAPNHIHYIN